MPRVRLVSPEVAAEIFEKAKRENLDNQEIMNLFAGLPDGEQVTWTMISRWRREWEQGQEQPKASPGTTDLEDVLGLGAPAQPAPKKVVRRTIRKAMSYEEAKDNAGMNPVPTPAKTRTVSKPQPAPAPVPAARGLLYRAITWQTADGELLQFAVPEVWAAYLEERLQALARLFQ